MGFCPKETENTTRVPGAGNIPAKHVFFLSFFEIQAEIVPKIKRELCPTLFQFLLLWKASEERMKILYTLWFGEGVSHKEVARFHYRSPRDF